MTIVLQFTTRSRCHLSSWPEHGRELACIYGQRVPQGQFDSHEIPWIDPRNQTGDRAKWRDNDRQMPVNECAATMSERGQAAQVIKPQIKYGNVGHTH